MGDLLRWPRDKPLSAKIGIKISQTSGCRQSVCFACKLKATEFVPFLLSVSVFLGFFLPRCQKRGHLKMLSSSCRFYLVGYIELAVDVAGTPFVRQLFLLPHDAK
jgi:hypothetical protein